MYNAEFEIINGEKLFSLIIFKKKNGVRNLEIKENEFFRYIE